MDPGVASVLPPGSWGPLVAELHPRVHRSRADKEPRPHVQGCTDTNTIAIPAWRAGQWLWTFVAVEDAWAIHWPWFVNAGGYVVRNHAGKQQYLHRLVCWCRREGREEPAPIIWMSSNVVVDHDDRDRLNNRRSNLVLTTPMMNRINQEDCEHGGVVWSEEKGKWVAKTKYQGKDIYLGYFHSVGQARRVVERYKAKLDRQRERAATKVLASCTGELLADPVPF